MGTVVIVDAANVVGSIPDGWWRDRAGAARRLRDALAAVATDGLPAAGVRGPVEVILVVEGAARGVGSIPRVRVVAASHSGDDCIVDTVRERVPASGGGTPARGAADGIPSAEAGRGVVVTADRGLRERVSALGAEVLGPRAIPYAGR
jgi:hypothetical protein